MKYSNRTTKNKICPKMYDMSVDMNVDKHRKYTNHVIVHLLCVRKAYTYTSAFVWFAFQLFRSLATFDTFYVVPFI